MKSLIDTLGLKAESPLVRKDSAKKLGLSQDDEFIPLTNGEVVHSICVDHLHHTISELKRNLSSRPIQSNRMTELREDQTKLELTRKPRFLQKLFGKGNEDHLTVQKIKSNAKEIEILEA